ncbi:helix-turn-helix domain-containing protein [Paracraurococcus lichenis]|uniref:Helix-turn-helix domain-containing protein n=1 Tax=Paracraurococcus lichenis TaxID=3064888 RepID=A0ABT9EAL6_9PROT|nr:helix-turn-helix domain-containing protein [Paracraurococcus sp. LOR1-02]MDO9713246.1 helix-turn-helix domain-containing protein [Paracraurococcus sp. LOR1-02]
MTQRRHSDRIKKGASADDAVTPPSVSIAPDQNQAAQKKGAAEVPPKQYGFGTNLIRLRKAAGLTQDELAAKSGISQSNISSLEHGTLDPRLSTVLALAKALKVPPLILLPGWDHTPDE